MAVLNKVLSNSDGAVITGDLVELGRSLAEYEVGVNWWIWQPVSGAHWRLALTLVEIAVGFPFAVLGGYLAMRTFKDGVIGGALGIGAFALLRGIIWTIYGPSLNSAVWTAAFVFGTLTGGLIHKCRRTGHDDIS